MQGNGFTTIIVPKEAAIKIGNVWKTFEKGHPVLRGFNMTVPKGEIYALLGSSGCGKTTILSCIVGQNSWDVGEIRVLGSPPYSKRCQIEPKRVGYMPQGLALHHLLTTAETILLFGRMYGMTTPDIYKRLHFLQNFLQLPKDHKIIQTLSGGEQRRVSLAVTLLHEPELIILDEPTVGLDPLLRQSIWEHLKDIVMRHNKTVVLTTHYIDEARRSCKIGLMRNGRLIAEDSPEDLMQKYQTTSLDTIVLSICKTDAHATGQNGGLSLNGKSKVQISSQYQPPTPTQEVFRVSGKPVKMLGEVVDAEANKPVTFLSYRHSGGLSDLEYILPSPSGKQCIGKCANDVVPIYRRLKGQILALFIAAFRNRRFMILTFLMPVVCIILIQLAVASDLHDLKFGIVSNNEVSDLTLFDEDIRANCLDTKFSKLYLKKISTEAMSFEIFANDSEARSAVTSGDTWGYLKIPFNYTANMQQRMLTRLHSTNETIDGTIIGINMDMSNYIGSILILKKLYEAYDVFLQEIAMSCGVSSEELKIPLKFESPVFGDHNGTYADQMVPGIFLIMTFIIPFAACTVHLVQGRDLGRLERLKVAGMANWDLIVTYLCMHSCFQIVPIVFVSFTLIFVFLYRIKGSVIVYFLICFSNMISGLGLGFLMGLLCTSELQAVVVGFGLISFLIPFSGTLWPVETLSYTWRRISYALPVTLAAQSFRSVMFRGVSLTHSLVWPGIAVQIGWASLALSVSLIVLRRI